MTISRTTLKKIIAEELSKGNRRSRSPSLASVLFEDAESGAKEIEDFMKTPLRKQGKNPAEKLSQDAKDLLKKAAESEDGEESDDKEIQPGSTGDYPLAKLKASQNEVGMKQSLSNVCAGKDATDWDGIDWGNVNWLVDHMKPGAKFTFKNPILAAKTANGIVVLDGHHRWSQAMMVNPKGQINANVADAGNVGADKALRAVHLAILAKTGTDKTISAKGGNLFNATDADITGYFEGSERKVNPETLEADPNGVAPYIAAVMKFENIKDVEEGKKKAIERIKDAIGALSMVSGAPPRDVMPQADPSNKEANPVSGEEVVRMLGAGEVNWSAPFVKKESVASRDDYIMERWNKLAGLIK